MPAPFPHHFSTTVSRTFAARARVQAQQGPATPEHLLLSSLGLSLLTTFEAFAARDAIEIHDWTATLGGDVERTPDGLMFTSIILSLDMELSGNVGLVEQTLEDAKQGCLVLNSLRVPLVVETMIRRPEQQVPERRAG
ncbi:MAG: OsmC family protein [Myxococcales bacterium]|nr:OsmC family protein [Myxococcales bacterium]